MSEWWLFASFVFLLIGALIIAFYPLRQYKINIAWLSPLLFVFVSIMYWHWGAWPEWRQYLSQQEKQQKVQAMLRSIRTPQELIDKLIVRVQQEPTNAKGWYLLGRLYASQDQWIEARNAYAKAYQLKIDEPTMVNYAHSLWQLNHQQLNDEVRALYLAILKKNAYQPDALAMLAMDAYIGHAYQRALDYWQQLIKIAPSGSEDARVIHKAIAKAQQKLNLGQSK